MYTEVADLYYNVLTHCNPEIQPPLMRDRGTRGPHTYVTSVPMPMHIWS